MADALAAKIALKMSGSLVRELSGGDKTTLIVNELLSLILSEGTTANKANEWLNREAFTITSGASENIDLYDLASLDIGAGAGKDALGRSWVGAELVCLIIRNRAASAGTLLVGALAATTAFNSIFTGTDPDDAGLVLPPGAFMMIGNAADPAYAIADTANHLLKLAASGGNVTGDMWICARNA